MSLTSVSFAIFVLVVLIGYYILPLKQRWIWLLITSAYFYISCSHMLSIWLLISALMIYLTGLWLDQCGKKYDKRAQSADRAEKKMIKKAAKREKNLIVFLCAAIQVIVWVVFKFSNVFVQALNGLIHGNFDLPNLVAPLGISFFMLQAISYLIDVKRGKCEVQKNPFKLALWLGFFPQMVQGPIARYSDTADQLIRGNKFSWNNIQYGAQLMLWGYFKKLIIANYAAVVANTIYDSPFGTYAGLEYLIGIFFYAIDIYGDFSGGIDIVSGCAQMLGVNLPENFRRPYFSRSVEEYWRRWHITLGTWFRDYIFYPMSISSWANNTAKHARKVFGRKLGNMIPTYIALMVVWAANGIWHGTGLQYLLWGFLNGVMIIIGIQFGESSAKFAEKYLHVNRSCFSWKLFQVARTFFLVCISRILFMAPSTKTAFLIFKSILTDFNPWVLFDGTLLTYGLNAGELVILALSVLVLLTVSILQERGLKIRDAIAGQNLVFRWTIYLAALVIVVIFGMYGAGYNAGDFIYMAY